MKEITAVVKITHGGVETTLKGVEAQLALSQLQSYNGVGNIYISYTNEQGNLTGFMFCCDDSWERLPNEVKEVEEKPCEWNEC